MSLAFFSVIWMPCLNITQMPATETHWVLRSPKLLHRNCSLDFIPTAPFQLLFLYTNHYLLTFSLTYLTAHLLIQHMMQLPQTGKNLLRAVKVQKTLLDPGDIQIYKKVIFVNTKYLQNNIFAITYLGRPPSTIK